MRNLKKLSIVLIAIVFVLGLLYVVWFVPSLKRVNLSLALSFVCNSDKYSSDYCDSWANDLISKHGNDIELACDPDNNIVNIVINDPYVLDSCLVENGFIDESMM